VLPPEEDGFDSLEPEIDPLLSNVAAATAEIDWDLRPEDIMAKAQSKRSKTAMRRRVGAVLVVAAIIAIFVVPLPQLHLFRHSAAIHPSTTSNGASTTTSACGPFPPRAASTLAISTTGRILWKTALPTHGNGQNANNTVPFLVSGGVGYFAQDDAVHALRLSDGRVLWSWTGDGPVDGTWTWHGVLVVLSDQVSSHAQLTALGAANGVVRWQLQVPGRGLLGTQAATADGGLAWLRADGTLQVVDLDTGKVRWSLRAADQAMPVAIDGLVVSAQNGDADAYNDQTGHRSWTISGLPPTAVLQQMGGLVFVTDAVSGGDNPTVLTAIDPLTGRVVWRFDPGAPVSVFAAGPPGLAVGTAVPREFFLLAPQTGHVLWHEATFVASTPAVLAHDVVSIEGGVAGYPVVRLVDRDAENGRLRWERSLPATPAATLPVTPDGTMVLVQTLVAYDLSSGRFEWRDTVPEFVQIPVVVTKDGIIVQAATPASACASAQRVQP